MRTTLEAAARRLGLARFSIEQYEASVASGILPEEPAIELLEGLLVLKDRAAAGGAPTTVAPEHQWVVNTLADLKPRFHPLGAFLSIQGPVRLVPKSVPEPDAAVVKGKLGDYRHRHAGPDDVWSVIEVADSSLKRDRTTKLGIYAEANISQYIIVNLVHRQVEVHTDPDPDEREYRRRVVRTGAQVVSISAGPKAGVKVKAKDLLP
jgi:Uma2 family endonuclease